MRSQRARAAALGGRTHGIPRTSEPVEPPAAERTEVTCDHQPGEYADKVREIIHGTRMGDFFEVVLSQVLADQINTGYDGLAGEVVAKVNGKTPSDLADFCDMLDKAKGTVELMSSSDQLVVMDADQARSANARILKRYHVPRDRSPDLS